MLSEKPVTAKVLPFRIIAIRIPVREYEKILDQLQIVSFHLNGDWSLDWEDRNEACQAVYDAITALREFKEKAEEALR